MIRRREPIELSVRMASGDEVAPAIAGEERLRNSDASHILFLVHGYNNSHKDAEDSYKLFIDNLLESIRRGGSRNGPDLVAKFHWPGDVSTMLGTTAGYPLDITNARTAAERVAALFNRLVRARPALRITLVGHSMGCRLILEALKRHGQQQLAAVGVVGLMAAASPVEFCERNGRLFPTGQPPRHMLKFFSEQDSVLQFAFPLGQWLAYQWQIEDDNYSRAMGRHGDPPEFGRTISRPQNKHGDYWRDDAIPRHIMLAIDPTTRLDTAGHELASRSLNTDDRLVARSLPSRESVTDTT